MIKLINLFLSIYFLFTIKILVYSQSPQIINVTASRIPWAPQYETSSIAIIESQDIELKYSLNNLSALRAMNNLNIIQSGGTGKQTSIQLRNLDSDKLLVLLDGVPINDPTQVGKGMNFSQMIGLEIERIEVVKGALSAIYGSQAVSGVMNIITKKYSPPTIDLAISSEQDKKIKFQSSLSKHFHVALFEEKSPGISVAKGGTEKDSFEKHSQELNYYNTEMNPLSISYKHSSSINDLDRGGGVSNDDPNYSSKEIWHFAKLTKNYNTLISNAEQKILFSTQLRKKNDRNDPDAQDSSTQRDNFKGSTSFFSIQHLTKNENLINYALGTDGQFDKMQSNSTGQFPDFFPEKKQNTLSFFAETTLSHHTTFLQLNGRRDRFQNVGVKSHFRDTYRTSLKQFFYSEEHAPYTRFSVGNSVKSPTLYQLYSSFGNKNLKEEKSLQWEMTIGQETSTYKIESTFFQYNAKNIIDFDFVSNKYNNIAKTKTYGHELELELYLQDWTWKNNINLIKTLNLETSQKLLRKPYFTYMSNLNYPWHDYDFNGGITYAGTKDDIDPLSFSRFKAQAYFLANFSIGRKIDQQYIQLNFSNIFNRDYEEISGFSTNGREIELVYKYVF